MSRPLKAWRLNEYEWWAHYTLEEAVDFVMNYCGVSKEDAFNPDFAGEANLNQKVLDENGDHSDETIGSILAKMTEPGFICGSEV